MEIRRLESRQEIISAPKRITVAFFVYIYKPVTGIYNCGTGHAQPFNDVALGVVNAMREAQGQSK